MATISYDDFMKLELRIALVESAEAHPGADRLVVLKIKVGEERKQIVAGIRAFYRPEDLVGRKIVVVNNLAPAVLRGVESQGMLLATQDGTKLALLVPDGDIADGSAVK
jgi:methionine--tRNA ligase beta chain